MERAGLVLTVAFQGQWEMARIAAGNTGVSKKHKNAKW